MSGIGLFIAGVATLAGVYAIWALILNMTSGWAGMWDLGFTGQLAVAGYTFIICTQTLNTQVSFMPHLPMWVGIILSTLVTGLVALLFAFATLRVRVIQFMIATLAFGEVMRHLAISQVSITAGTLGFSQFPRPFQSLVHGGSYRILLLVIVWLAVAVVFLIMRRLAGAPFIRLLRGSRDNEPVALSLGKRTNWQRIQVFAFGGILYGATIPLYLWYVDGLVPGMFAGGIGFTAWTCLVIGGISGKVGPVIGAVVLIGVTEATSFIQGSSELAALMSASRWMLLGLLLCLVMRFLPDGLLTERSAFAKASARFSDSPLLGKASAPVTEGKTS